MQYRAHSFGCDMSNFSLSTKSLRLLDDVHDDLARVCRRAIIETSVDFGVSEGLRTRQRQEQLLFQKKTTTLHSLHLRQKDGFAHAIDVFAWVNDQVSWQPKYYGPIVQAFMTAAIALGVQIQCGHLWKDFHDSPHIQLNPKFYGGNLVNDSVLGD